jgi:hypothetical protein
MPDVLQLEEVKQVTSDKSEPRPSPMSRAAPYRRVPAGREGLGELKGGGTWLSAHEHGCVSGTDSMLVGVPQPATTAPPSKAKASVAAIKDEKSRWYRACPVTCPTSHAPSRRASTI